MKKRRGVILITVLLAVVLSAQNLLVVGQIEKPYGGTLRIAYRDDVEAFNPFLRTWGQFTAVYVQIFSRLVTMDENYDFVPDLATSWEIADNGKKYTFHLVSNATWHDGNPFTSEDVKFHFELMMGRYPDFWNGSSPTKSRMMGLLTVDTPDDYTVVFTFDRPKLLYYFAGPAQADNLILPKHIYWGMDIEENPANDKPIGTGPFKFGEYVVGSHLILEANKEYFMGRPYLDRLVYKITKSTVGALMSLYAGEIDSIDQLLTIPLPEVDKIRANPKYDIAVDPVPETWFLLYNQMDKARAKYPWLTNKDVLTAMRHAIDFKSIMDSLLYNCAIEIDSFISPVMKWCYNPNLKPTPEYDPEKAEELLDGAGYPRGPGGVRFKADIVSASGADIQDVGEAIKFYLELVGIEIDLQIPDPGTLYSLYYANPDMPPCAMMLDYYGSGPDPELMLPQWHSKMIPPVGYNCLQYNNSRVDELLDKQAEELDIDKRREQLYEIQVLMQEDILGWPLYSRIRREVWSSDFGGFETHVPQSWFATYRGVYLKGEAEVIPSPPYALYAGIVIVVLVIIVAAAYVYRKRKTQS